MSCFRACRFHELQLKGLPQAGSDAAGVTQAGQPLCQRHLKWLTDSSWAFHDSSVNPAVPQAAELRYAASLSHISNKCLFQKLQSGTAAVSYSCSELQHALELLQCCPCQCACMPDTAAPLTHRPATRSLQFKSKPWFAPRAAAVAPVT